MTRSEWRHRLRLAVADGPYALGRLVRRYFWMFDSVDRRAVERALVWGWPAIHEALRVEFRQWDGLPAPAHDYNNPAAQAMRRVFSPALVFRQE